MRQPFLSEGLPGDGRFSLKRREENECSRQDRYPVRNLICLTIGAGKIFKIKLHDTLTPTIVNDFEK